MVERLEPNPYHLFVSHNSGNLLQNLVPNTLRNPLKVRGLGIKGRATTGQGAQRRRVSEQLGEGDLAENPRTGRLRVDLSDLPPPAGEVTDHVTHVFLGVLISTVIIGSRNTTPAFLAASFRAMEAAILKAISEESTGW